MDPTTTWVDGGGNTTVPCNISAGDTAWVLISTVLVLGMMPALALFEAGLLRSKNTLSLVLQIFSGITILGFLWDVIGFSLTFGPSHAGIIGDFSHALLINVPYDECHTANDNISAATYCFFMMMFALITPLLMTGAFAERLRFRSFVIVIVAWEILVFYPLAHWIWAPGGWLQQLGALDFAGGIVIHTSAGAGSLVMALMLGRRKNFARFHGEFPPSNVPMAALGAALLWMGWFGFNAGSALGATSVAISAVASTQIAACCSGMVWLIASWIRGKPSSIAVINGVIAGLAGITPASGYISSQATLVIGVILGIASYFSVILMKNKLKIDDALDVVSVHGLTGLIGSLSIGFCAQANLNPDVPVIDGLIFSGNGRLLGVQALAIVVAIALSAIITFLIAIILKKTIGLGITPEEEDLGLDSVEHGEQAYRFHKVNDHDDEHYSGLSSHDDFGVQKHE